MNLVTSFLVTVFEMESLMLKSSSIRKAICSSTVFCNNSEGNPRAGPSVGAEEARTLHLLVLSSLCKPWLQQEANKSGDQSTAAPDLQLCCSYVADKMVEIVLSEMWMDEF